MSISLQGLGLTCILQNSFKQNFFVGDQENSGGWGVKEILTMPNMSRFFLCLASLILFLQTFKTSQLERLYNCVVGCLVIRSVVCNAGLTARADQTRLDQTKLKCHQNWNVTKTEMFPKLICHHNWNLTKKFF